jgi:hypothetical protein
MKQKFLAYQQDFLNFLKRHGLTKRIGGYLFIGYVLAFIYLLSAIPSINLAKFISALGITTFLYFGIIFATYAAFHYIRDTYRDSKPTFYIVGLLSIFGVYFVVSSYNPYDEGTYAPCGEWDECSYINNIMAADDWQAICDSIDNSTVGFQNSIFGFNGISSDTPLRAIVQNGYVPSFTFSSYKYASGNVSCDFKTRVKGSYKGTDYNKEVEGKVSRILVTEEGVLAHAANYSQVTAYVTKKK